VASRSGRTQEFPNRSGEFFSIEEAKRRSTGQIELSIAWSNMLIRDDSTLLFSPALALLLPHPWMQAWKERLSAIGEVVTLITITCAKPAAARSPPLLIAAHQKRPHKNATVR